MVKIDNIVMFKMKVYTYDELEYIYPIIIVDGEELILIDTGYPNYGLKLEKLIVEKGLDPRKIKKIILTHHDHDHIGGVKDLYEKYPNLEILSSSLEGEYISGRKKSLRLEQAERNLKIIEESQKKYVEEYIETLLEVENVNLTGTLKDSEYIDSKKKWKVLSTPGHTPGHISLYNEEDKILIAGNALVLENGSLEIGNPGYCHDIKTAYNTRIKLLDMDIDRVYCYHGGLYKKNKS